ncbi:hypothetical protein HOO65_070010 [Ceratocystis lukuohia]|uniref:HTH CENPB-type domain-containing protein n=1 Tax=Ceratocystis lukuohia TaxID=2019550 RepID=A0ABR4MB96_9PEZI
MPQPNNEEEETILQLTIDLDSRGFAPRLRGVEEMANKLLADHDVSPVGKRWASNFRAKCKDPAIIRSCFTLVENTIAKYSISLSDVYNFDETGFMMGVIASGIVITGAERRGKVKSVQLGNWEWGTAIQAINAEGWAIALFIVVAGRYHLAS